ncbi:anti-sigma-I factor RsgI family protein [Cohnella thermotolerans]|uniref:anti-sigma-I factor RsgI family protein n=1 Tax=Cohnella thermotolerans TaxID=329858 RepID=UPI0004094B09|nr:anti-sigma factor domain-containing protein [Cohnella thermotolerans]
MNRAIVMSLEGKRAIVLAPGGRFVRVPRRPEFQIGDEIELEVAEEQPGLGLRKLVRNRSFAAAIASCAAVVLLLIGFWSFRTPPVVAYVSMDVNPSVELGIDAKERVRELQALNADAEPIVAAVRYKGEDVETVTAELAEEMAARHLLNGGESEVVLASVLVRNAEKRWEAEVTEKMKRAIETAGAKAEPDASGTLEPAAGTAPEITTVSVPKEVRDEAKANGLSAGKMAFWLKAESQGHDVPLEALKHRSMKKIASSWGGVKQVLGGDADSSANGGEDWKALLEKAQDKVRQMQESRKQEPNGQAEDHKGHGGGRQDRSGKSPDPGSVKSGSWKGSSNGTGCPGWGRDRKEDNNQGRNGQARDHDRNESNGKTSANGRDSDAAVTVSGPAAATGSAGGQGNWGNGGSHSNSGRNGPGSGNTSGHSNGKTDGGNDRNNRNRGNDGNNDWNKNGRDNDNVKVNDSQKDGRSNGQKGKNDGRKEASGRDSGDDRGGDSGK